MFAHTNTMNIMINDYRLISYVLIEHTLRDYLREVELTRLEYLILLVIQYRTHYLSDPEKTSTKNLHKVLNTSEPQIKAATKILKDKNLITVTRFKHNYYYLTDKAEIILTTFVRRLNKLECKY